MPAVQDEPVARLQGLRCGGLLDGWPGGVEPEGDALSAGEGLDDLAASEHQWAGVAGGEVAHPTGGEVELAEEPGDEGVAVELGGEGLVDGASLPGKPVTVTAGAAVGGQRSGDEQPGAETVPHGVEDGERYGRLGQGVIEGVAPTVELGSSMPASTNPLTPAVNGGSSAQVSSAAGVRCCPRRTAPKASPYSSTTVTRWPSRADSHRHCSRSAGSCGSAPVASTTSRTPRRSAPSTSGTHSPPVLGVHWQGLDEPERPPGEGGVHTERPLVGLMAGGQREEPGLVVVDQADADPHAEVSGWPWPGWPRPPRPTMSALGGAAGRPELMRTGVTRRPLE